MSTKKKILKKNIKAKKSISVTGRTTPLYPRVKLVNKKWVTAIFHKVSAQSESEFMDIMLDHMRKNLSMTSLKKLVAKGQKSFAA